MIVTCTDCSSKYSVNDAKVKGKRFGFNCPKCGASVEIDNREAQRKEPALPSGDEFGIGSGLEREESIFAGDMGMPDIDDLGEISEAGETAEDAINIAEEETGEERILSKGKESPKKFEDTFLDEIEEAETIAGKESAGNLLDDFSPMEEDTSYEKRPAGKSVFEEELSDEEAGPDSILMDDVKSDEIFSRKVADAEDEDESITIDLDSLDIQLEEDQEAAAEKGLEAEELSESFEPSDSESLEIMDFEENLEEEAPQPQRQLSKGAEDDEDITLDLDSLDLTLDEVEELKEGESLDADDERISLSDAGLTADELVTREEAAYMAGAEDEDIRLHIDEVAPEVSLAKEAPKKKAKSLEPAEEELPVIDFDKFEEEDDRFGIAGDEDLEDLRSSRDFKEHEAEIASPDADIRDTVPAGMINFSIDYSLKFSRAGAVFRLLGLYPLILIPHFIVLLIYSVLSVILSFFNWIIIAFTGIHEEDFTEIQKNTIRYLLSLNACSIDVVEDMPKFAGRKDIEYALQYDATYPVSYSRVLAILRISIIGILLAALPHIILLVILSMGSALICLIGMLAVIITKRWPNILFDFMVRYYRYTANVLSYISGVVDRYPSFKF